MEEDNKMDINEPLNLEEAANTLIEMGLKELGQPQRKRKERLRKRGPRAPKKTIPGQIPNIPALPALPADEANVKLQEALQLLANKITEVDELKEKLKSIEQNMLQNSNRPRFSTPEYVHPLNFIENLSSYLESNPSVTNPIETAMDCLYDDAKSWAILLRPRWVTIDDFKRDFLHQYWGNAQQSMLRQEIINDYWNRDNESMSRHFMCLVAQAKWLTHPIPDEELIFEIMHHYPKYVQVAWVVSKNSTILEAIEFLTKLEDIDKQTEGKKIMRQRWLDQNKNIPHKKPAQQSTSVPVSAEHTMERRRYLLNTPMPGTNTGHVADGNDKQNEDSIAMRQRLMEQCKHILDRKWVRPTEVTAQSGASENMGAVINV